MNSCGSTNQEIETATFINLTWLIRRELQDLKYVRTRTFYQNRNCQSQLKQVALFTIPIDLIFVEKGMLK
jgi:hypothetical protein